MFIEDDERFDEIASADVNFDKVAIGSPDLLDSLVNALLRDTYSDHRIDVILDESSFHHTHTPTRGRYPSLPAICDVQTSIPTKTQLRACSHLLWLDDYTLIRIKMQEAFFRFIPKSLHVSPRVAKDQSSMCGTPQLEDSSSDVWVNIPPYSPGQCIGGWLVVA
jgi:hypothetical protein